MNNSNVIKREHIGNIKGNLADKQFKVFQVKFPGYYRIMYPFYGYIDSTTGWVGQRDTYTKVWNKIPSNHKVGNEKGEHDQNALIDYAATIMITFDSARRLDMQEWWLNVFDNWITISFCNAVDIDKSELRWVNMNGALSLLGHIPSVVYGGDLKRGKKQGFDTLRYLVKECSKLTKTIEYTNCPLEQCNPYEVKLFLFNNVMQCFLSEEAAMFVRKNMRAIQGRGL